MEDLDMIDAIIQEELGDIPAVDGVDDNDFDSFDNDDVTSYIDS